MVVVFGHMHHETVGATVEERWHFQLIYSLQETWVNTGSSDHGWRQRRGVFHTQAVASSSFGAQWSRCGAFANLETSGNETAAHTRRVQESAKTRGSVQPSVSADERFMRLTSLDDATIRHRRPQAPGSDLITIILLRFGECGWKVSVSFEYLQTNNANCLTDLSETP